MMHFHIGFYRREGHYLVKMRMYLSAPSTWCAPTFHVLRRCQDGPRQLRQFRSLRDISSETLLECGGGKCSGVPSCKTNLLRALQPPSHTTGSVQRQEGLLGVASDTILVGGPRQRRGCLMVRLVAFGFLRTSCVLHWRGHEDGDYDG